jgi:hypothetical protein
LALTLPDAANLPIAGRPFGLRAASPKSLPMNLAQIQDLIKFVAKSGVSEVEIEQKDFKITIKTPQRERRRCR